MNMYFFAVGSGRFKMGFWTQFNVIIALFFWGGAVGGHYYAPNPNWGITMTYVLTGIIFIFMGLLIDKYAEFNQPQQIPVFLKHEGHVWLLIVLRSPQGEFYAPGDASMRKMTKVDIKNIPKTIPGCPYFTKELRGDKVGYEVLGQFYCSV